MLFLPTDLPGVTFLTTKRPVFNTIVVEGDGGISRRNAIALRVRWYFRLNYEFVQKTPPGVNELYAFAAAVAGPATTFLYRDPTDNLVLISNGSFQPAVADGTTTTVFQIGRTISSVYPFFEMLTNGAWNASFGSDAFRLYVNGLPYSLGDVAISVTGGLTFTTPPAAGSTLSWAGNFYFPVHFKGDPRSGLVGDKFMNNYWEHTTVELESSLQGVSPAAPVSPLVLIDTA